MASAVVVDTMIASAWLDLRAYRGVVTPHDYARERGRRRLRDLPP